MDLILFNNLVFSTLILTNLFLEADPRNDTLDELLECKVSFVIFAWPLLNELCLLYCFSIEFCNNWLWWLIYFCFYMYLKLLEFVQFLRNEFIIYIWLLYDFFNYCITSLRWVFIIFWRCFKKSVYKSNIVINFDCLCLLSCISIMC